MRLRILICVLLLLFALPLVAQEDTVETSQDIATATVDTISEYLDQLVQPPQNDAARLLLLIGGIVLLLLGWRVYEFIILISGILIGAAFGSALFVENGAFLQLIGLLIGAIIGGVLAVALYYVAAFFAGAYVGIVTTNALGMAFGLEPVTDIALIIGGLLGGVLLVFLSLELLIVLSSIVGAQMLALGLGLSATWVLVFAVAGVIIQLLIVRSRNMAVRRRPRGVRFRQRAS